MATVKVASITREYIRVPVNVYEAGQAVDPTPDVVQMAFVVVGVEPVTNDWKGATWERDFSGARPAYFARALVGPSTDFVLADGTYDVWVRVFDSPEIPVAKVGRIVVT